MPDITTHALYKIGILRHIGDGTPHCHYRRWTAYPPTSIISSPTPSHGSDPDELYRKPTYSIARRRGHPPS